MSASTPEIPEAIRASGAKVALVLGSGLGELVDDLEIEFSVSYSELAGIPASRVFGHAGRLSVTRVGGEPVLIAQGRVHLYEGWSASDVAAMVRLFHRVGVRDLVLTNAAGSLCPEFQPGRWMLISDHLNLTGASPLTGAANFADMSQVYDEDLRGILRSAAAASQIPLGEGVYAGLPGPQYETPAEIRMLRTLGADAVGMSTVLEAIQARALGLHVSALSCLTNWGAGLSASSLDHSEVIEMGRQSAGMLGDILKTAVPTMVARNPDQ